MTVGVLLAFEFTVTVPVRDPGAAGSKSRDRVQKPPAATVPLQSSDSAKMLAGDTLIEDIVAAVLLRLRSFTTPVLPETLVLTPTTSFPKLMEFRLPVTPPGCATVAVAQRKGDAEPPILIRNELVFALPVIDVVMGKS